MNRVRPLLLHFDLTANCVVQVYLKMPAVPSWQAPRLGTEPHRSEDLRVCEGGDLSMRYELLFHYSRKSQPESQNLGRGLRRSPKVTHFCSFKLTHAKKQDLPNATKVASDIIHAAGVRGLSLHHLGIWARTLRRRRVQDLDRSQITSNGEECDSITWPNRARTDVCRGTWILILSNAKCGTL